MKRKLITLLLMLSFSSLVNAQIFSQDFESSTSKSVYISATPSFGEFTAISNSSQVVTSIRNGALRFTNNLFKGICLFRFVSKFNTGW